MFEELKSKSILNFENDNFNIGSMGLEDNRSIVDKSCGTCSHRFRYDTGTIGSGKNKPDDTICRDCFCKNKWRTDGSFPKR